MKALNLGINENGNTWKLAALNFAIIFIAQVAYGLVELLPTGDFPTFYEFYKAGIIGFVTTLGFYGINKITHRD